MDVKTSSQDMTIQLHLDSVMVQDKARPNDSPFRNMIYSTPDETSHGGLIHVTYWASTGGVRRVPPTSIADTHNQEYDMVVDARFSTLQVGGRRSGPAIDSRSPRRARGMSIVWHRRAARYIARIAQGNRGATGPRPVTLFIPRALSCACSRRLTERLCCFVHANRTLSAVRWHSTENRS